MGLTSDVRAGRTRPARGNARVPERAGVRALGATAAPPGEGIPPNDPRASGRAPEAGRAGLDAGRRATSHAAGALGPSRGPEPAGRTGGPPPPGPPPTATLSRRAALAGLGALAGCGFAPALAPGERGRIAIEAPETRAGFALRGRLLDRLGPPGRDAPYRLAIALAVEPDVAAVDPAQVATRLRLDGAARYALIEAATGREQLSGTAEAFASYDATGTSVALGASARDAEERLATILADRIAARLLAATLP